MFGPKTTRLNRLITTVKNIKNINIFLTDKSKKANNRKMTDSQQHHGNRIRMELLRKNGETVKKVTGNCQDDVVVS